MMASASKMSFSDVDDLARRGYGVRRLYVCTFEGCMASRPTKKFNCERHIWLLHLRHQAETPEERERQFNPDIHRPLVQQYVGIYDGPLSPVMSRRCSYESAATAADNCAACRLHRMHSEPTLDHHAITEKPASSLSMDNFQRSNSISSGMGINARPRSKSKVRRATAPAADVVNFSATANSPGKVYDRHTRTWRNELSSNAKSYPQPYARPQPGPIYYYPSSTPSQTKQQLFDTDPSVQSAAASLHDIWHKMQRSGPFSLDLPGQSDPGKLVNPSATQAQADSTVTHWSKHSAGDPAPVPAEELPAMQTDTTGNVWRPWAVY